MHMKLTKENVCDATRFMIEQYYQLNNTPFFSVLSDDCIWLDAGNYIIKGSTALQAYFTQNILTTTFQLEDCNFQMIDSKQKEQLIILGEFMLIPFQKANASHSVKQRITFCYRLEKNRYLLYHMHVSNAYHGLVDKDQIPIQINIQSYQYIKHLIEKSMQNKEARFLLNSDTRLDAINLDMVVYIEAINKKSIIHMMYEKREIRYKLKDVNCLLPYYFYRYHRSYIINCRYITKITRSGITFITGNTLPVPKKKFLKVKQEITTILEL